MPAFSVCHQDRCDCGGRKSHIWFYGQQLPLWFLGQQCVTQCADAAQLSDSLWFRCRFGGLYDPPPPLYIASVTTVTTVTVPTSFFRSGPIFQGTSRADTMSLAQVWTCWVIWVWWAWIPWWTMPIATVGTLGMKSQCSTISATWWYQAFNWTCPGTPTRMGCRKMLHFLSMNSANINQWWTITLTHSNSWGWHMKCGYYLFVSRVNCQLTHLEDVLVLRCLESWGYFLANDSIQGCADAAPYCNSITKMPEYAVDDGGLALLPR